MVVIGDQQVQYHALTRAQALHINKLKDDPDESEAYIIASGTNSSIDEAREWRQQTSMIDVGRLMNAIIILSGLATEEQLADPLGEDQPLKRSSSESFSTESANPSTTD